jgi:hypothetical protein
LSWVLTVGKGLGFPIFAPTESLATSACNIWSCLRPDKYFCLENESSQWTFKQVQSQGTQSNVFTYESVLNNVNNGKATNIWEQMRRDTCIARREAVGNSQTIRFDQISEPKLLDCAYCTVKAAPIRSPILAQKHLAEFRRTGTCAQSHL